MPTDSDVSTTMNERNESIHGVACTFRSPSDVFHAAEKVRDAGWKSWDVHTPFPIHGMDQAMGLPRSKASLSGSSMIFFQRESTLTVWLTSFSCWISLNTNRFCFKFASFFTTEA